jgi:hypothetical protein
LPTVEAQLSVNEKVSCATHGGLQTVRLSVVTVKRKCLNGSTSFYVSVFVGFETNELRGQAHDTKSRDNVRRAGARERRQRRRRLHFR